RRAPLARARRGFFNEPARLEPREAPNRERDVPTLGPSLIHVNAPGAALVPQRRDEPLEQRRKRRPAFGPEASVEAHAHGQRKGAADRRERLHGRRCGRCGEIRWRGETTADAPSKSRDWLQEVQPTYDHPTRNRAHDDPGRW